MKAKAPLIKPWNSRGDVFTITSNITFSMGKVVLKVFYSRCPHMVLLMALILWSICNQEGIWKENGWCLTTVNMCNIEQPWVVMFVILYIIEFWPLQFATCNPKMWNSLYAFINGWCNLTKKLLIFIMWQWWLHSSICPTIEV
jgi:hypothetical protein